MRKDHLRLVTDAGASLDLGWDYGIPYQIDNLSGVDVTLKTAQGVNQQGRGAERRRRGPRGHRGLLGAGRGGAG